VVGVATKDSAARATTIRFGPAVATWVVGFFVGMGLAGQLVLIALGVDGDDFTIPQIALSIVVSWAVFLAAMVYTSDRYGSGERGRDFVDHYALNCRPIDLLGVPAGALLQLVVVPLVYVPLRELWPATFSQSELEERAQELADKADGWTVLLLFAVVAVGAPIVEELVYRGLLQRSMATVTGAAPALVLTSIWFSLIHFTPVEYPGLFVAGLGFGAGLFLTGRIGPSIVTHAAFNATGLVLALW
jgi:membrane protease YdiL (CAAX protease family)